MYLLGKNIGGKRLKNEDNQWNDSTADLFQLESANIWTVNKQTKKTTPEKNSQKPIKAYHNWHLIKLILLKP